MGTGEIANGSTITENCAFPSQELPCSGSTGIISASWQTGETPDLLEAPRGMSRKNSYLDCILVCNFLQTRSFNTKISS
jgi:hypothetical protein